MHTAPGYSQAHSWNNDMMAYRRNRSKNDDWKTGKYYQMKDMPVRKISQSGKIWNLTIGQWVGGWEAD